MDVFVADLGQDCAGAAAVVRVDPPQPIALPDTGDQVGEAAQQDTDSGDQGVRCGR
jgi:hypothetical protein